MSLYDEVITKIKEVNRPIKIVYAEGWNSEIIKAAKEVLSVAKGIIQPVLIFRSASEIPSDLPKDIQIVDISTCNLDKYANTIFELRKHKNVTLQQATQLARQSNFLASTMVYLGEADGEVCGIEYTTADTLRAALQIVRARQDVKVVCSAFVMEKGNEKLVFGDSSVNINPSHEELASITKSIAHFATDIAQLKEVRIAMLSYSTVGSGKGESVDKVRKAYELVLVDESFIEKYKVFGEIQFDAAYDLNVMHKKAKNLDWKEPANVFVFPNIDAGNIGYKIAQRLGKYQAIGPVVLGLNKPVNDLSRGASASDVAYLTYLTALQAVTQK